MPLEDINKAVYRKNLNIVIVCFISTLLILSLLFGAALIATFGVEVNPDGSSNNFNYNLLGVILSLLFCMMVLHQLKNTLFFKEIYYVWTLKQLHNRIYRKIKKIRLAAKVDDINALIILNFYHHSRKQVYLLDDNTLTLTALEKEISELNDTIANKNLSISIEQFEPSLIASY